MKRIEYNRIRLQNHCSALSYATALITCIGIGSILYSLIEKEIDYFIGGITLSSIGGVGNCVLRNVKKHRFKESELLNLNEDE